MADNWHDIKRQLSEIMEEEELCELKDETDQLKEQGHTSVSQISEADTEESIMSTTTVCSTDYDDDEPCDSLVEESMLSRCDGVAMASSHAFYIESVVGESGWSGENTEAERIRSLDLIRCNHDDYSEIDPDLRMHLEKFSKKNKIKLVMECEVVQYLHPSPIHSLVVMATDTLYIFKVRGALSRHTLPQALHLVHELPLTSLTYVDYGLHGQSFRLESGPREPSFKILVRDQKRCKRFLKHFTVILMDVAHEGQLQRISHDRLTPYLIRRDLFGQKGRLNDLPRSPGAGQDPQIRLYVMVHQVIGKPRNGNGEFVPVSIIVSQTHVVMATELHHLHRWVQDSDSSGSHQPPEDRCFMVKDLQLLRDIQSVEMNETNSCDVSITFGQDSSSEFTWRLTMATEFMRETFITMVTDSREETGRSFRVLDSL